MNNLGAQPLAAWAIYCDRLSVRKILQSSCGLQLLFAFCIQTKTVVFLIRSTYFVLSNIIYSLSLTSLEECKWSPLSKTYLPTAWHKCKPNIKQHMYPHIIRQKYQTTLASSPVGYQSCSFYLKSGETQCTLVNIGRLTRMLRRLASDPVHSPHWRRCFHIARSGLICSLRYSFWIALIVFIFSFTCRLKVSIWAPQTLWHNRNIPTVFPLIIVIVCTGPFNIIGALKNCMPL